MWTLHVGLLLIFYTYNPHIHPSIYLSALRASIHESIYGILISRSFSHSLALCLYLIQDHGPVCLAGPHQRCLNLIGETEVLLLPPSLPPSLVRPLPLSLSASLVPRQGRHRQPKRSWRSVVWTVQAARTLTWTLTQLHAHCLLWNGN